MNTSCIGGRWNGIWLIRSSFEARTDLKSEKRWRDRLEPYHHQITNLITFCGRLVVVLTDDEQKQSGGRGRKGAVWSSQRGRLGGSCV